MKKALIFLFVLFIPLVFAQSIQVDYPSSVKVNEEFSLNLKLIDFTADTYDIKIDINPDGRIAQIYNNGIWKSTYYYINEAISVSNSSNEGNFKIKIIKDFQGTTPLEIKIKSSKDITISFTNYTLNIEGVETNETTTGNNSNNENNPAEEKVEEENDIIKIDTEEIQNTTKEETEIIILTPLTTSKPSNPKDIKSEIDKEELNKNKLAIYGLIVFCILLVFLFIFKKRNKEKNEFK